jgi:DNA-binding response OmpR family regulator
MGFKIVVVDRTPSALKAAELALPAPEFEVAAFGDGLEALRAIPDIAPDAVLAGLSLPSRDGYEIADFVKSQPHGRQTAVVFLRGPFEPLDAAKIAPIDHDGIVVKPFDGASLLALVRAAVDRRKELPSLPEEPVRIKSDPPAPPAGPATPPEWTAELETTVRELVRREIGLTRKDIEAIARDVVMTEVKRTLVEELAKIETKKF